MFFTWRIILCQCYSLQFRSTYDMDNQAVQEICWFSNNTHLEPYGLGPVILRGNKFNLGRTSLLSFPVEKVFFMCHQFHLLLSFLLPKFLVSATNADNHQTVTALLKPQRNLFSVLLVSYCGEFTKNCNKKKRTFFFFFLLIITLVSFLSSSFS